MVASRSAIAVCAPFVCSMWERKMGAPRAACPTGATCVRAAACHVHAATALRNANGAILEPRFPLGLQRTNTARWRRRAIQLRGSSAEGASSGRADTTHCSALCSLYISSSVQFLASGFLRPNAPILCQSIGRAFCDTSLSGYSMRHPTAVSVVIEGSVSLPALSRFPVHSKASGAAADLLRQVTTERRLRDGAAI